MAAHAHGASVAPRALADALAHVAAGGRLFVATPLRVTVIDQRTVARFQKVGAVVLKEEGEGYRLYSGKSSVYLLPGQLRYSA